MRVYYDLILWEDVDDYNAEALKSKMTEMAKRFVGYGCLSFNMRGGPQPQPVQQQTQIPAQQAHQAQPAQPQEEVIEE